MQVSSRRLRTLLFALSAGSALAVASSEASASGYLTARFGGDYGAPQMANTYAVYFNPAALGGTTGTTITADASLAIRNAHYERTKEALSPSAGNAAAAQDPHSNYFLANTGDANLSNVVGLPFLGVNTDFGTKSLRAGYAVYVPFGGSANWSRDRGIPQAPGSLDGVQRWQNISGQILAIYNTFALAYKIGDTGLSIGASVSPVIHHVATVRARTPDDSDDIEESGGLKEGRSLVDASGFNIAASAGLYWQTNDGKTRVGATYLSQPGFGETRMGGTLKGVTVGGATVNNDIDFLQTYPDIIRLGVAFHATDALEVRMDGEFVRWNVFDHQCLVQPGTKCNIAANGAEANGTSNVVINVQRNWHNAWGYRAGVGYEVSKDLEIGGSLGFSTAAVPKAEIDVSTIDSFTLTGTIGGRYRIVKQLAVGAAYTHVYLLPVDTEGQNNFDKLQKPSQSPSADGKYSSQIGLINLNVAYTF